MKQDCNLPVGTSRHAQIERGKGIPMARRFNGPPALRTADRPVAIDIGKTPDQPVVRIDLGESVDHQLQRKGFCKDVGTDAADLRDAAAVAKKQMLLAVHRLQKCLPAPHLGQGNDAAKPDVMAMPDIGGNDPAKVLGAPEDLGFERILIRIGERYKGPRPRPA